MARWDADTVPFADSRGQQKSPLLLADIRTQSWVLPGDGRTTAEGGAVLYLYTDVSCRLAFLLHGPLNLEVGFGRLRVPHQDLAGTQTCWNQPR